MRCKLNDSCLSAVIPEMYVMRLILSSLLYSPDNLYRNGPFKVPVCRLTEGFRMLRLPEFSDSRHTNVARLSALLSGRLYPPGNFPGVYFC
jgi:hypothetical protein